ncbi:MAG: hypothetical protein EOM12_10105 [Verrucomicrobiae bacterium]|nr:hypothetical protein [Verrucomicrobiae bacterium]
MHKRVEVDGRRLDIESASGQGTSIRTWVPLSNSRAKLEARSPPLEVFLLLAHENVYFKSIPILDDLDS